MEEIVTTGRRKTAVARVRMSQEGEGQVTINSKTLEEYFPSEALRSIVLRPLLLTERLKGISIRGRVVGGGIVAQAGALSHGVSRALIKMDAALRGALKKEGLLRRDSRMKERKKYGQKGARKRFQFSKR
ncbi:MAG: 30S ribosomal protein S9 [Deltaproteobacteria bacterium]|nr:30S ribosomal protein S9 [Deltaproteobacteria bacterium]MBI3296362.1 30S ribosomal protein S9 [Deltaproteobacteria bacterium]